MVAVAALLSYLASAQDGMQLKSPVVTGTCLITQNRIAVSEARKLRSCHISSELLRVFGESRSRSAILSSMLIPSAPPPSSGRKMALGQSPDLGPPSRLVATGGR